MDEISARKQDLRRQLRAKRATQNPDSGASLADLVLNSQMIPARAIIGGFMPMREEIDIRPLLQRLYEAGHVLALPETPPPGQALIFRAWTPDCKMQPGRFGTSHPEGDVLQPDFLLVPLLGFDLAGNRLGYGGGYYDRTIAALPSAFRLGCAYGIQQVERIPTEPTDQKLHAIATEQAIITV